MKRYKKLIVALLAVMSIVCLMLGAINASASTSYYNADGTPLEWKFDAYGVTSQIAYQEGGNTSDSYQIDSPTYNYANVSSQEDYVAAKFANTVNPYLGMVDAYNDYQIEPDGSVFVFKNQTGGDRTAMKGFVRLDLNSGLDITKPISIKFYNNQNAGWDLNRNRYYIFSLFNGIDNLFSFDPDVWWADNSSNTSIMSVAMADSNVMTAENQNKFLGGKATAFGKIDYTGSFVREWHTLTMYIGTEDYSAGTNADYSYILLDGVEIGGIALKQSDFTDGIYLALGCSAETFQTKVQLYQPSQATYTITKKSIDNLWDDSTLVVKPNMSIEIEDAPDVSGYTFDGWYFDEGCTLKVGAQEYTKDVNVYAKYRKDGETYHTVTLTSKVGNYTPVELKIKDGDVIPEILDVFNAERFTPTFKTENGTLATGLTVNSDMTLYANWEEDALQIYYRIGDGEPILDSPYSYLVDNNGWDESYTMYQNGSSPATYFVTADNKIVVSEYYGSQFKYDDVASGAQFTLAAVGAITNHNKIDVTQELIIKYKVKNFDFANGNNPSTGIITFALFDNMYDALSAGHRDNTKAKVAIETNTIETQPNFGRFQSVKDNNVISDAYGWTDATAYEIRIKLTEDGTGNQLKINGDLVEGALQGVTTKDFAAGYAYLHISNEGSAHEFYELTMAQGFQFNKTPVTEGGSYTTSVEEGTVLAGTDIVVTLSPENGYGVSKVMLGDVDYSDKVSNNQVTVTKGWGEESLVVEFGRAYTVTFDSKGGTPVDSQIVVAGKLMKRPEQSQREGYKFKGWYSNAECTGQQFNFLRTPITGDITLYAKWEADGSQSSGGCGSAIVSPIVCGVAIVASLGALAIKKKKNK